MKLFGWGQSKDIQPQTVLQQVKNSDPRNSRHGLDRGASMGPRMPSNGTSTGIRNIQQGLFGVNDDGCLHGASPKHKVKTSGNDVPVCDEILQDTIRFVFSKSRKVYSPSGRSPWNSSPRFEAQLMSTRKQQQQQAAMARTDSSRAQPVYGSDDVYTSGIKSEAERAPNKERPKALKGVNQSKALTLYKPSGNRSPIAGVKPIVLLTALPIELRKLFNAANLLYGKSQLPPFVPHWTDSVPTPVLVTAEGPWANEESYYSSRFCGLFGSKKRSSSSKRGTVQIDSEESKKLSTKVMLNFGSTGMPSLGKLAKMWRCSCKQSSARIAPESKPCSTRPSQEFKGPPCTANGIEREVLTAPATQPQSQI